MRYYGILDYEYSGIKCVRRISTDIKELKPTAIDVIYYTDGPITDIYIDKGNWLPYEGRLEDFYDHYYINGKYYSSVSKDFPEEYTIITTTKALNFEKLEAFRGRLFHIYKEGKLIKDEFIPH